MYVRSEKTTLLYVNQAQIYKYINTLDIELEIIC